MSAIVLHIFLASRNVTLQPISGQDFYIKYLVEVLEELGHKVVFIPPKYIHFLEAYRIFKHDIYVHHYYTNMSSDIRARVKLPQAVHILYVFQFYDASWTLTDRMKYLLYLYANQLVIDKYVVSGRSVYVDMIKTLGVLPQKDKVYLVKPYYPCNTDSYKLIKRKLEALIENRTLELIYVGRVNRVRIDIQTLFAALKLLAMKFPRIKLTVISMPEMGLKFSGFIRKRNLEIEFVSRRLTEECKKLYYERAHVFLYLARLPSAMSPPMAPIEAVCYGTIPILTRHIAQEFKIPSSLVINDDYQAENLAIKVENAIERGIPLFEEVYNGFAEFYSKVRFIRELSKIMKKFD